MQKRERWRNVGNAILKINMRGKGGTQDSAGNGVQCQILKDKNVLCCTMNYAKGKLQGKEGGNMNRR